MIHTDKCEMSLKNPLRASDLLGDLSCKDENDGDNESET